MNFLKATTRSARFVQRRGISGLKSQIPSKSFGSARCYSTVNHVAPKQEGSSVPWVIGSIAVFGPILFKLTSPPPSKKKAAAAYEHVAPVAPVTTEEDKEEAVAAPVKNVQKPYVLVGAGTASFAAAQAIREKDPEANVNLSDILRVRFVFNSIFFFTVGYYHWRRRLCTLHEV